MSIRTPWSQSSLPSDRIKPQPRPANTPNNKGKAKQTAVQQPPKSAAVRALETIIKKLHSESGDQKDSDGGCFCLARTHELSPYCPLCSRCGLILCSVNSPYYACPHCAAPLLSSTGKEALLERLRTKLAATIAKEEEDVERSREEARQAAGAFPSLAGDDVNQQKKQQQRTQAHKVLSLNSRTKRVTVASYTTPPAPPLAPPARSEVQERDAPPERVRAPPSEIAIAQGRPDTARPWVDMRGDGFVRTLTYVRDPRIDREQLKGERKARKAKKKENVGGDGGGGDGMHAVLGNSTN